MKTSYNSKDLSSIGKTLHSAMNKRLQSIKSQQRTFVITNAGKKPPYPLKTKGTNNSTRRELKDHVSSQNKVTEQIKDDHEDHLRSVDNKSYEDKNHKDLVSELRKEIQEWKINEILTCRSEERFIGTPSEQHSCNCVTSGETSRRQQSPNSIPKSCRTYGDFPTPM